MAGSGFPNRKSSGAGGMTSPGAGQEQLDGPPPSPVMANAQPPVPGGGPAQFPSFAQMSQPLTAGTPGRATSPEVAMGILQSAEAVFGLLDSIASIIPDLANDMMLQKDLLQRSMAKLTINTGASGAGQSAGLNFPGGGFARGAM